MSIPLKITSLMMNNKVTVCLYIWVFYWLLVPNISALAQMKPNTDTTKFTYKRYTIKKYSSQTNLWQLEVYQNHQKVFGLEAKKAGHLQYVAINGQTTSDITQDGHANLILQQYLDTPNEEVVWHILSLAPDSFQEITSIKTQFGSPWLADFEQDGKYEVIVKDYVFANWNADFLNSPYHLVYLALEDGKYLPSKKLMQQAPPRNLEEITAKIQTAQEEFYKKNKAVYPYEVSVLGGEVRQRWSFIPSDLWATLLQLYYTAHSDLAQDFLNQAWYAPLEGKEEFWKDFQAQIAKSPYWEHIKEWQNTQSLSKE